MLTPHQALAQAGAAETRGNEIIVTARRREETLQDVPVTVIPITKEAIENNLTTDLLKLSELAPQVIIGKGNSGTGAIITMRGISTTPTDGALDQSVSFVYDGVQLSRGKIIGTTLFDIAQVEVMQGPQALYFGKNSPAGVISVRSAGPTDELEGFVRAGY
ncbi:hypothetical protein B2G71_20555 [Novosphingobium sp. PC22D]|nr:hypothetical protein B2G71_20555 [Novosphingobium sp. PC22D]